jgi:MFS family permease
MSIFLGSDYVSPIFIQRVLKADLPASSVATALPRISSDLHAGRESSWVATAYLLTRCASAHIYPPAIIGTDMHS